MIAKSMRQNSGLNNQQRTGNSAPMNRRLREQVNKLETVTSSATSLSSTTRIQRELITSNIVKIERRRSRKLTLCLICFASALSCLLPFASLHLNQRVGLLLFESDLVQLRSSFFTTIICLTVLVIFHAPIILLVPSNKKSWMTQRISKQLVALFASISAISYLSVALIVPQVKQIQRMPLATFDCKANLITIENCHQQFTAKGGEQTIYEASRELLIGNLDETRNNNGDKRLIKKLDCLKYNDRELETLEVPTRFLLHNCGLVCKPQRQQLHQFNDDFNREQSNGQWSQANSDQSAPVANNNNNNNNGVELYADSVSATSSSSPTRQNQQKLIPPYHHDNTPGDEADLTNSRHYIYHNASSPSDQFVKAPLAESAASQQRANQVSIKVCFSGEFTGGSDTYKQFCITNLANHGHTQEHTLTVGQLNAMLRRFVSPTANSDSQDSDSSSSSGGVGQDEQQASTRIERQSMQDVDDQTTHYVNPVVQFESHFKNWPYLPMDQNEANDNTDDDGTIGQDSWCKFRPIPPFIVNNKPFSDIQCALEQEYTMTTGPPTPTDSLNSPHSSGNGGGDKIYLKKSSTLDFSSGESLTRERCNIQCKVNILYQVHMNTGAGQSQSGSSTKTKVGESIKGGGAINKLHYYLPLKPCIVVAGEGDKTRTLNYYLIFKTLGDSSLLLTFILLDLFLLLESIETKQFQLESKNFRLIGLIAAVAFAPLIIAFIFDTVSIYYPPSTYSKGRREGYLTALLYERVLPTLVELFSSSSMAKSRVTTEGGYTNGRYNTSSSNQRFEMAQERRLFTMLTDNHVIPFFVYSILMFILATCSLTIPLISSSAPLQRVSSTEELGMIPKSNKHQQSSNKVNKKQQHRDDDIDVDDDDDEKRSSGNDKVEQRQSRKLVLRKVRQNFSIQMISIYLLALFMGTQFNLSQISQLQIFIETFGNPSSNSAVAAPVAQMGSHYSTLWFVLSTQSGVIIFILLLVIVFQDEISSFFANFSPFKATLSALSDNDQVKRNKAKFLNYLTLSLVIYSIRYFAISNLTAASRFKWTVLFLFQLAELFNFPIIWFALSSRVHELVTNYRAQRSIITQKKTQAHGSNASLPKRLVATSANSGGLDLHIAIQSSMAFTYFAISKSFALFAHSLNASIHLHSDNVDWFITSFYRPKLSTITSTSTTTITAGSTTNNNHINNISNPISNSNNSNGNNGHDNSSNSSNASGHLNGKPESLFSPLPGERQTYLHASRLFLRYNSLLCLILGLIFLVALLYVKYQIWAEQRRTFDLSKSAQVSDNADDTVDDQLSLDLMRIHSTNDNTTRNIYPDSFRRAKDTNTQGDQHYRSQSPRAKILFHYNLDRNESSDSTTSQQSATAANDFQDQQPPPPEQFSSDQHKNQKSIKSNVPIAFEEEEDEEDFDNDGQVPVVVEEQFVQHHRNRRVRIFEDGETWPELEQQQQLHQPKVVKHSGGSGKAATQLTKIANNRAKGDTIVESSEKSRKRSITFAPLTTLIGDDGTSEHFGEQSTRQVTLKRASPDPSLDFESDSQNDD